MNTVKLSYEILTKCCHSVKAVLDFETKKKLKERYYMRILGLQFLVPFLTFIFCNNVFQAMPKRITGAKIACLDFSLQKAKMKMGVQVLIEDPSQLDMVRQR